jgi:hypothetical protein
MTSLKVLVLCMVLVGCGKLPDEEFHSKVTVSYKYPEIPHYMVRLDRMDDSVFVVQIFDAKGVMTDLEFHADGFRKFTAGWWRNRCDGVIFDNEDSDYGPREIPLTHDKNDPNYQAQINDLRKELERLK